MTIEQAIEYCDRIMQEFGKNAGKMRHLKSFLQSQQDEIDNLKSPDYDYDADITAVHKEGFERGKAVSVNEIERLRNKYERVCPDCGGDKYFESSTGSIVPEHWHKCERCQGTGYIPRWQLPDWFVKSMVGQLVKCRNGVMNALPLDNQIHLYTVDLSKNDSEPYDIARLTKTPDGWELTEAGVE